MLSSGQGETPSTGEWWKRQRKVLNAKTFGLHVCMERTISETLSCPSIYREGGRRIDVGSKRKKKNMRHNEIKSFESRRRSIVSYSSLQRH